MLAGHPDDTQALRDIGVGLIHVGEALELLGDQEGAPEIYLQLPLGEKLVRADPDSSRDRRYLAWSSGHYSAAWHRRRQLRRVTFVAKTVVGAGLRPPLGATAAEGPVHASGTVR